MDFKVYAIRSLTSNRIYVGQTANFERRLDAHNAGRVNSTQQDCPWELLKMDSFDTRSEARWFERQLKSSLGRRQKWLSQ